MKKELIALLLLLAAVSPALAGNSKENARTRKLMHDYAKCVVKAQPAKAAEAIIANVDNASILARYPSLISSDCMGRVGGDVRMSFSGDLYRYALADALVNANFLDKYETDFSNRLPLAHIQPFTQAELDAELAKTKNARRRAQIHKIHTDRGAVSWLSRYGECLVRADPVRSRLWLLTPPDVPEEMSRINDLRTVFNVCMGEGTVEFSRTTLRGVIAINYFRLANATARPTAGKGS